MPQIIVKDITTAVEEPLEPIEEQKPTVEQKADQPKGKEQPAPSQTSNQ